MQVMRRITDHESFKKYNIEDERKALHDSLAKWIEAVGSKDFYGGSHPNLADLCVFGTIRAIEGYATHTNVLTETQVGPWYDRMASVVGDRSNSRAERL
mmetsp:Transcript_2822/g.4592  ORF Transcript_2822/g.4592 Transcript_2822/m.4592 type:complete len:99 (-) Transcript_2822:581-877(-)